MGQLDLFARLVRPALVDVDRQIAELEPAAYGLSVFQPRASRMGGHAGHELAEPEGLGDVVVGADLEGDHSVDLVRPGAHHDHRDSRVHLAQLAADVETGRVWQGHLEQHHVGP